MLWKKKNSPNSFKKKKNHSQFTTSSQKDPKCLAIKSKELDGNLKSIPPIGSKIHEHLSLSLKIHPKYLSYPVQSLQPSPSSSCPLPPYHYDWMAQWLHLIAKNQPELESGRPGPLNLSVHLCPKRQSNQNWLSCAAQFSISSPIRSIS